MRDQAGVTNKLHRLAKAGLRYAQARLDLLQHEWREERRRLLKLLARSALFALGLLATYQLAAAAIVIAFWDTAWRLHSVLALTLITGGISGYAWRSLQAAMNAESEPLAGSIAEFDKDRQALSTLATATAQPTAPENSFAAHRAKPSQPHAKAASRLNGTAAASARTSI